MHALQRQREFYCFVYLPAQIEKGLPHFQAINLFTVIAAIDKLGHEHLFLQIDIQREILKTAIASDRHLSRNSIRDMKHLMMIFFHPCHDMQMATGHTFLVKPTEVAVRQLKLTRLSITGSGADIDAYYTFTCHSGCKDTHFSWN